MKVGQFRHEALLYQDRDEFLAGAVQFIAESVAADEPVLVATPLAGLTALREALPDRAAAQVRMVDMAWAGRNPGRILPALLLRFADEYAGRPVRVLNEPVWPGRDELAYPACVQHEALVNTAFAGQAAVIRCLYDARRLDRRALADAERTHPRLATAAGTRASERFTDPLAIAAAYHLPLPPPPATATVHPVDAGALGSLRERVAETASAAGLPGARVGDATIAVNELAINTVVHSGGAGTLAIWSKPGLLACQLTDSGYLTDPLTGRVPPARDSASGRGLYAVQQVCDLVRIHTVPGQTTVRVHLSAQPAPPVALPPPGGVTVRPRPPLAAESA